MFCFLTNLSSFRSWQAFSFHGLSLAVSCRKHSYVFQVEDGHWGCERRQDLSRVHFWDGLSEERKQMQIHSQFLLLLLCFQNVHNTWSLKGLCLFVLRVWTGNTEKRSVNICCLKCHLIYSVKYSCPCVNWADHIVSAFTGHWQSCVLQIWLCCKMKNRKVKKKKKYMSIA